MRRLDTYNEPVKERTLKKLLFVFSLFTALAWNGGVRAEEAAEQPPPVWKMVYYRIKPGMADAFWKDMRENGAPMFGMAKEAGILADFMLFRNSDKAAPDEWDALLMLKYHNWAGLDQIEARAGEFYLEHYGAERLKTLGEEREAMREVLSNRAVRGVRLP